MRPYGYDALPHVLDDTDARGCAVQGAPSRNGRVRGKATTRRRFAKRARAAAKAACREDH